ncbi:MAG: FAD-dependent oxidoreductase [Dehalococcoidales bacterium]|nr:FAD-dependent oxidoreductase [Dehalococcoidales bacterium]
MAGKKKEESQLVIIGGGGAGLAAAVEASEKGLHDILVIEKNTAPGGNSAIAGGIFACESPVQERLGIPSDRDRLYKRAMDWAHWSNVRPDVLRAFINKSGETVRWLEDKGLEFDLITFYPGQMPPVQHNPRGFGAALVRLLRNECNKQGVRILCRTAAQKIVRGDDGAVAGIEYKADGKIDAISCRSIIIATGGFSGNKELMRRYFPHLKDGLVLSGVPLNGDGIFLAEEAGAAIEDSATMIKEGPRFHIHQWPLLALERNPVTVWVNRRGERFTDESTGYHIFESVNPIMNQPGMACFTLADSSVRRYFEENISSLTPHSPGGPASIIRDTLEKGFRDGVRKGIAKVADRWEDIASWIGAGSDTLKKTVARYNESCRQGYDADFIKERRFLLPLSTPPFYAVRDLAVHLDTIGGIRIDDKMRVTDRNNLAIPGLYAAGVVTSGWESEIYCSELSASAFGFAINSGRIAGENAAAYLASS